MDDRVRIMREIQNRTSTHQCPECDSPTYCAMEDGKSANLCWCMSERRVSDKTSDVASGVCLCKSCLCEE